MRSIRLAVRAECRGFNNWKKTRRLNVKFCFFVVKRLFTLECRHFCFRAAEVLGVFNGAILRPL